MTLFVKLAAATSEEDVKAALMKTEVALPLLRDRSIAVKWGKSASDITPEALDAVSQFIGTHFVSFRIETQEREFVDTVKRAIASGEIVRTQITPDNLKQVFDRWVEMVGREITSVASDDYCRLFFADVMSDGTVSTHENLPVSLYDKLRDFCFRIRTRRNDKGEIVEALYGKIYGDISFAPAFDPLENVASVCMLYYLNPTSLDRNLEWDMKTNLCPNPGNVPKEP